MTTREFQKKQPLSILFAYFKPHRGLFALDLVCATIVALIDLAFPMVTRKSMYDLLPQQQYRAFFVVMGVMMAAFIVRALLYYVIAYWGHTFGIRVEAGAIRIDGEDVRALTQTSLHRAIGVVQQDVFLFADTVRENIRYGRPDATDEEIVEAAKRAEIYDDIMAMPHGFDTYVGERGTMLSGGQKQRVSIARIFLKNPPILILDEATSALDSVTEVKIQHAFDELSRGRTTLVIAHRLSTIRSADRILVIEDGRIAEQGSHEELLKENGEYASLWRTQNGAC